MAKKLSILDINKRIIEIFNDSLYLKQDNVKNTKDKVLFHCKIHGDFIHSISKVLKTKKPCPRCNSKLNNDIIPLLMKKHNNVYDYSLVYDNVKRNIDIICKDHGVFKQDIYAHLNGSICPVCSGYVRDNFDFINKCIKVHGDKYDYSKTFYKGAHKYIIIICKKHGEFKQMAYNHTNGQHCKLCSTNVPSLEECITDLNITHNNKYEYFNLDYHNRESIVDIFCREHGNFVIKLGHHLNGVGCKKCSDDKNRLNNEIFIAKSLSVHGDLYNYESVDYISYKNKVILNCYKHGDFLQIPGDHLKGSGCPKCKTSNGEILIINYLDDNYIDYKYQHKFDDCRNILPLPFDFYIPKLKICIEFDGSQHYESNEFFGGLESFERLKINDDIKNKYCINNNIELYRIPYWNINNIDNILDLILK